MCTYNFVCFSYMLLYMTVYRCSFVSVCVSMFVPAYCDVLSHLHCYSWVLHEAERYGEKWHKKWAQEYAIKKIASELPVLLAQHARTVDTELFPSWTDFLAEFCSQGGVIEGCPHAESVTSLSVDVLIEPTGNVNILSTQDQV